jgi:hypothetical protein
MLAIAYRSDSDLLYYLVVLVANLDVENERRKVLRKVTIFLHLTLIIAICKISPGFTVSTSVPDPDPYVFMPPGSASGSVCHKYGSGAGSGSFPFLIKVIGLK